jgi:hypothetical protein
MHQNRHTHRAAAAIANAGLELLSLACDVLRADLCNHPASHGLQVAETAHCQAVALRRRCYDLLMEAEELAPDLDHGALDGTHEYEGAWRRVSERVAVVEGR